MATPATAPSRPRASQTRRCAPPLPAARPARPRLLAFTAPLSQHHQLLTPPHPPIHTSPPSPTLHLSSYLIHYPPPHQNSVMPAPRRSRFTGCPSSSSPPPAGRAGSTTSSAATARRRTPWSTARWAARPTTARTFAARLPFAASYDGPPTPAGFADGRDGARRLGRAAGPQGRVRDGAAGGHDDWGSPRPGSATCRAAPRPAASRSSASRGGATTRRARPTRPPPTTPHGSWGAAGPLVTGGDHGAVEEVLADPRLRRRVRRRALAAGARPAARGARAGRRRRDARCRSRSSTHDPRPASSPTRTCPSAARTSRPRCGTQVDAADVVVHAGDWVDLATPRPARGAGRGG